MSYYSLAHELLCELCHNYYVVYKLLHESLLTKLLMTLVYIRLLLHIIMFTNSSRTFTYCSWKFMNLVETSFAKYCRQQGRWKCSSYSGFGWTSFSQGKNKFHFFINQVINKSISVIFGLLRLSTLSYNRQKKHINRCKIIDHPRIMLTGYLLCKKLSNK